MNWEPVIGLEVHVELKTASKMFCSCPVVDVITASPNSAVCPVCLGLPGALPVINRQAVELAVRSALALDCRINPTSIFARKNYFYPDLPKGYQISQYEYPLAENGELLIQTATGEKHIRIRRAHLEEDTGKLTHIKRDEDSFSLVDLNRAGVPLLEIVTEPDMRSVEEAREYATTLHSLLRYIGVSSCDMEKGAIRFEANVSIRQLGTVVFNTRTEIKNLNSFKAMEKAIEYEMQRQIAVVEGGGKVRQETVGWNDLTGATFSQRGKEEAHDYRYFPEPDLPPLAVDDDWLDQIRSSMPELPRQKQERLKRQYNLTEYDARVLVAQVQLADFFEEVMAVSPSIPAKSVVNWITGSILAWMNNRGSENIQIPLNPEQLAGLVSATTAGTINLNTAKAVLDEMLVSGKSADEIIREKGLTQIDDRSMLRQMIRDSLAEYPQELASYLAGKDTLANWFLGQVMRKTKGQAAPQLVQTILAEVLKSIKDDSQSSD